MRELPSEIDDVLAEHQKVVETWDYSATRQSLVFMYEQDGEQVELAIFQGPLPVPHPGQTITLHNTAPLVVDRVETDYDLGDKGDQHASVNVYVKLPLNASRKR